jgi:hypothetical protein
MIARFAGGSIALSAKGPCEHLTRTEIRENRVVTGRLLSWPILLVSYELPHNGTVVSELTLLSLI